MAGAGGAAQGSPRRRQAHGKVGSGCPSGRGMVAISAGNVGVGKGREGWGGMRREHVEAALLLDLSMRVGPMYLSCTVSTACGWKKGPQVKFCV